MWGWLRKLLFLAEAAVSSGLFPLLQQKAWLFMACAWPEWAALETALAVSCAREWPVLPAARSEETCFALGKYEVQS